MMKPATILLISALANAAAIDSTLFRNLEPRNIGPAIMGGRTVDIQGIPGNPAIVYVASASGGLWKTANAGTTWTPLFDNQSSISIGTIALDPKAPDVIWVGTGEATARNSVSFGDGVYKSTDGGKTWRNMGLRDSNTISRIVINPLNTNVVYVAALGHNSGPNEERGVFMTSDGGEHWTKVLYIDPQHGAADMDIDPMNPNIVYAAMWRFDRKPWKFESGGEKGGLFRSIDGGLTWNKVTAGLPKMFGRMGVRVAAGNSKVVYVIGETNEGTLFRSDDSGDHFRMMSKDPSLVGRGLYYSRMTVDPTDENRIYTIGMGLSTSIDAGKTIRHIASKTHSDYHAVWVDPKNPSHVWQGDDGGFYQSWDRGETWDFAGNVAVGQFYQVNADNRAPFYHVFGGLQDNGTYTGPSRNRQPAGILNDDWQMVSFGDGFHVISHPDNPDLFLSENQGGGISLTDMRTLEQRDVSPQPKRNDGGPVNELKYRFNWNSPIVASPHDKNTVYFGGNIIFKTTDFGKTWNAISPDLSTNDPEKLKSVGTIWTENTTAEYHCTVVRIAESPVKVGQIWAGTDDGNVQLTNDGGKNWTNLTGSFPGVPKFAEVASIEPSRTNATSAYVAFEHHWFDDKNPYLFKTIDGGKTWTNIAGNLPATGYIWVVKEDPKNPKLLYVGTELGLFVSLSGGNNWVRLAMKGFPQSVAVRDLMIHPRENDLIIATHGRALWVLDDVTPLQQLSEDTVGSPAALFDVRPALRFDSRFTRYGIGDRPFGGKNPAYGSAITYFAREKGEVKVQVLDGTGKVIRDLDKVPREAGLNRVVWDLRIEGPAPRSLKPEEPDAESAFQGPPRGPQVMPGKYTVRLTAGGKTYEKPLEVKFDPSVKTSMAELKTQYEYGVKLRDMQSSANTALRGLDTLKEQLDHATNTVSSLSGVLPKDLANALAEQRQQVGSMTLRLIRPNDIPGYSMGPRLVDRLRALSAGIDRVLADPTKYQAELADELRAELQKEMEAYNKLMTQDVPATNNLLRKVNGPVLMPAKNLEVPR
jgi:photosystem II stability/assembly factor-like uncharacterized protein